MTWSQLCISVAFYTKQAQSLACTSGILVCKSVTGQAQCTHSFNGHFPHYWFIPLCFVCNTSHYIRQFGILVPGNVATAVFQFDEKNKKHQLSY